MNLIDRYVYAVTRHLPDKQRSDIEKELGTLIEDMLEQQEGSGSYEEQLERVLLGLGDPSVLADSYREKKRYLIGPQNFDNYIMILKIVSGAVFIGMTVASTVGALFNPASDVVGIFVDYVATLFYALLQGFAWVTIGFAIAEHKGVDMKEKTGEIKAWSLSDLPVLPQKEAAISRAETIISIIFTTVFTSILFFAPQLFSAYIKIGSDKFNVIPIFNIDVLGGYKAIILIVFLFGITKEAFKLLFGRWTLKLSLGLAALNAASLILTLIMFANPEIWNAGFASAVLNSLNIKEASAISWMNLQTGTILVLLLAHVIEIVTGLYKGYKYDMNK